MLSLDKFKDAQRNFGVRDGKLFTRQTDGPEKEVWFAGQNRFDYGLSDLSWFAVRQDASNRFLIERHSDGGDEVEIGVRKGSLPTPN